MGPPAKVEQEQAVEEEKFTVCVVGADGIRNADWLPWTGKSDCYTVVSVGKGDDFTELFKTEVQNDTLNPVWKEEKEVTIAKDQTLKFSVYDKDLTTSDLLGTAEIPYEDFKK